LSNAGRVARERAASPARRQAAAWSLTVLVTLALLLGGGGAQTPPWIKALLALGGIVELGILALVIPARSRDPRANGAILLLAAIALVLLVQLVPLPPAIWRALPGRALSTEIRDLLGQSRAWLPFTLDPESTRSVALSLFCPIAAFLGVLHAGGKIHARLLLIILAVAVLDLLLGALQVASGGSALQFYDTPHNGFGIGLFANRNHNADFLLIAPLIAAALLRLETGSRLALHEHSLALVALGVFLVGVVITTSRMGLVLIPVPILGVLVLFASKDAFAERSARRIAAVLLLVAALLALLALLAAENAVVANVIARFAGGDDRRYDFWPDVVFAIGQYWPMGSGSGTFDPVFRTVERLDTVLPSFVNHAHNDYLEIVLELGAGGVVLLVAFFVLYFRRAYSALFARRGRPVEPVALAALFALAVLLLHSLVDYPMRLTALGTLFAVLCGMAFSPAQPAGAPRRPH
jgi:O-antigen ligase